jgi:putative nucleotidyltransferase-like protein
VAPAISVTRHVQIVSISRPTNRQRNRELRLGLAVAALLGRVDSRQSAVDGLRNDSRLKAPTPKSKDRSPKTGDHFPGLEELSGLLCHLGAGALAWWRIRDTGLANTPADAELHNVYRQQRLAALRHERDIREVVSLLRSEGVEPVLVKGWASARHYPERGLRPYGDIDLCVSPTQFAKASRVLKRIESLHGPFVDLHCGFSAIGVGKRLSISRFFIDAQAEWDDLYSRSTSEDLIPNSGFQIRVLSDEDHLRILCLHLLRSGARRPAWLGDVALLVSPRSNVQSPKSRSAMRSERGAIATGYATTQTSKVQSPTAISPNETLDIGRSTFDKAFDWNICLGQNPIHANWVATAVLLAHELLGADISHTPFAGKQLPRWIVVETLRQWGRKAEGSRRKAVGRKHTRSLSLPVLTALPTKTFDIGYWTLDWYRRWDNPIRATAAVSAKFSERPRLRHRLAELIQRIPELPDHWRTFRIASRQSRVDSPRLAQMSPLKQT